MFRHFTPEWSFYRIQFFKKKTHTQKKQGSKVQSRTIEPEVPFFNPCGVDSIKTLTLFNEIQIKHATMSCLVLLRALLIHVSNNDMIVNDKKNMVFVCLTYSAAMPTVCFTVNVCISESFTLKLERLSPKSISLPKCLMGGGIMYTGYKRLKQAPSFPVRQTVPIR